MGDGQRFHTFEVRPTQKPRPSLHSIQPSLLRAIERFNALQAEFKSMASMLTHLPSVTITDTGQVAAEWGAIQVWEPRLIELRLLMSETLHHLRATADHLVFHVAWIDSGSVQTRTQFPIFSDPGDFAGRQPQMLRGVNGKHRGWFEALQPYNDVAWTASLADLSNHDKHKHLHDVVPSIRIRIDTETRTVVDGVKRLAVDQPEVHLILLRRGEDDRRVDRELSAIIKGLVDLINRFLTEFEEPLVRLDQK